MVLVLSFSNTVLLELGGNKSIFVWRSIFGCWCVRSFPQDQFYLLQAGMTDTYFLVSGAISIFRFLAGSPISDNHSIISTRLYCPQLKLCHSLYSYLWMGTFFVGIKKISILPRMGSRPFWRRRSIRTKHVTGSVVGETKFPASRSKGFIFDNISNKW